MLANGRIITHITTNHAAFPWLPGTTTAVCNDGTVWTKTEAPLINLFGGFMGHNNGHNHGWVQMSAPPAPVQLQPVYIQAQPVQGAVTQTVPVMPAQPALQLVQSQPQPMQFSEHREYRSDLQPAGGQQGGEQRQGRATGGDRGEREQGREQVKGERSFAMGD